MAYSPTTESLQQHPVPEWFSGAKLGIFVHWGLYSIPGWAEIPAEWIDQVNAVGWAPALQSIDPRYALSHNVYAEWYQNTLRFGDSPVARYHREQYGPEFQYHQFAPLFNQCIQGWEPGEWAALFKRAGARYVVLTTKHHDGFLLWPSRNPCPRIPNYQTERDVVGELTSAVRRAGLKMGLYYSGGLDWSFSNEVIDDFERIFSTVVQEPEFVAYVNAHWRELIDRYQPSILWNDIGYPAKADVLHLFADYYNRTPDGVINDRFRQATEGGGVAIRHSDYLTPEYQTFDQAIDRKWETCRGIGYSFGYNQCDDDRTYMAGPELIRLLIDVVSKNGNLLLGVGPMADGTIPLAQRSRLEELGDWLAINGEAIYDTRPWVRSEGVTAEGIPVRFTCRPDALYAILLRQPEGTTITLADILLPLVSKVSILGYGGAVRWDATPSQLRIGWDTGLPEAPAYAIRIALNQRMKMN